MITYDGQIPYTLVKIKNRPGKRGGGTGVFFAPMGHSDTKVEVTMPGVKGAVDSVRIGNVTVYPPLRKPQTYAEQGRDIAGNVAKFQKRERLKFEAFKESLRWYRVPLKSIEGGKTVDNRYIIDHMIKDGVMEEKDIDDVKDYLKDPEAHMKEYFETVNEK